MSEYFYIFLLLTVITVLIYAAVFRRNFNPMAGVMLGLVFLGSSATILFLLLK